ncbi:MAG: hypothetical protein U0994_10690 [Gemmatimonadales bacterium]|nr:hypothetical protein [Gemmatimonadales bacterium]
MLAVSLVVTLMAGWVQVGEAEAGARAPVCEPEYIIVASGSCGEIFDQVNRCNETAGSNCVRVPTSCENSGGDSGGFALYCQAFEIIIE